MKHNNQIKNGSSLVNVNVSNNQNTINSNLNNLQPMTFSETQSQIQTSSLQVPIISSQPYLIDNAFKKTIQIMDNNSNGDLSSNSKSLSVNNSNLIMESRKLKSQMQVLNQSNVSSRNSIGTILKKPPAQLESNMIDSDTKDRDIFDQDQCNNPPMSSHFNLRAAKGTHTKSTANAELPKKEQQQTQQPHRFHDLLTMLKAKMYSKQWRKFMPSRMQKMLGSWHYNLLSDKTLMLPSHSDKRDFFSFISDSNQKIGSSSSAIGQGNSNNDNNNNEEDDNDGFYQHDFKMSDFFGSESSTKSLISSLLLYLFSKIPLISASGNFRLMWDILQMVNIMAFQCFVPLYITFNVPFYEILPPFVAYPMYFILVFDIFVNMNTSYYDKGKQITNRKRVILKYLRSQFILDFLPLIPLSIDFLLLPISNDTLQFLFLVFFLKLKKMYRIMSKMQDRFHLISSINSYMQLFKLFIVHLLVSHFFACFWIILGKSETGEFGWMQRRGIDQEHWIVQYINSYYFVTLTMVTVGYGDITPVTNIEIIACILTMTFACGIFAYSVSEIGTLIQDLKTSSKEINKNLQTISKYMHNKNVSNELKYEIREYLLYYWTEESNKNGEKENIIINQLSDSLKETLIIEANHLVLSDSPVFRDNFSPEILRRTVPLIKEFRCTPEEVIYCEGETDEGCIYFIEKGSVEIFIDISTGSTEQFKPLKQLRKGDNFGSIGFFTGLHRTQSVRSLEFTTLLMIKREEFLALLREFPQDYERFCFLRDKISIQRDYQKLGLRCYSCKSFFHVLNDCPYLHYVANRFKVIRKATHGQNSRQKDFNRISILRYRRSLTCQQEVEQQARIYLEENDEYIDMLYEDHESIYDQTNTYTAVTGHTGTTGVTFSTQLHNNHNEHNANNNNNNNNLVFSNINNNTNSNSIINNQNNNSNNNNIVSYLKLESIGAAAAAGCSAIHNSLNRDLSRQISQLPNSNHEEEDIRTSSMKHHCHKQSGKQPRNTFVPSIPLGRPRLSFEETSAAHYLQQQQQQQQNAHSIHQIQHVPITSTGGVGFHSDHPREKRKDTIQIHPHRQQMLRKLSRLPTTESKGTPVAAASAANASVSAIGQQVSGAVGSFTSAAAAIIHGLTHQLARLNTMEKIEKSFEKLGTANHSHFAVAAGASGMLATDANCAVNASSQQFILIETEAMKLFNFYFPHNNFNRIIDKKAKKLSKCKPIFPLNKRKSKRSTIKSSHRVETLSMNSLHYKFEQQQQHEISDDQAEEEQYDEYSKSQSLATKQLQSRNSLFSSYHNSGKLVHQNFSQRSFQNALKMQNLQTHLPNSPLYQQDNCKCGQDDDEEEEDYNDDNLQFRNTSKINQEDDALKYHDQSQSSLQLQQQQLQLNLAQSSQRMNNNIDHSNSPISFNRYESDRLSNSYSQVRLKDRQQFQLHTQWSATMADQDELDFGVTNNPSRVNYCLPTKSYFDQSQLNYKSNNNSQCPSLQQDKPHFTTTI